jgi:two-component system, NarL family, nitrate/nitrite response regulator NarL
MSPRILVVDGHPVQGQLVRSLLKWVGLQVVGLAADRAAALRLAHELYADVVVLNLTRPLVRCFDTARALARAVPPRGVILVAFEDYLVEPAFQAGIRGYVLSNRVAEELPTAIRTVGSGGRYRSPTIPAAILVSGGDPAAERSLSPDRVPAMGPVGS